LRNAFKKLPAEYRDVCNLWDIAKENGESEKCEAFVKQFEKVYKQTPSELKEKLANSDLHLETESQARGIMGLMHLATVMSKGV
jgi:F0F1-type ATP synthase delta subunit